MYNQFCLYVLIASDLMWALPTMGCVDVIAGQNPNHPSFRAGFGGQIIISGSSVPPLVAWKAPSLVKLGHSGPRQTVGLGTPRTHFPDEFP